MATAHEIILVAGVLCLLAIVAGQISSRIGMPLLLVFIGVGVLAGEDGPGGIRFDDFHTAYLVGSLALAAILFDGGLSTERAMIRQAIWPSLALAGVGISAGLVGGAVVLLFGASWPEALLLGRPPRRPTQRPCRSCSGNLGRRCHRALSRPSRSSQA